MFSSMPNWILVTSEFIGAIAGINQDVGPRV